jgi:cytochrome P450
MRSFNLLGLPMKEDRQDLIKWSHQLKDRDPGDPRLTPLAKAATESIKTYLAELLTERRRNPREDLLTHLVTSEIEGVPFAESDIKPTAEIVGLIFVLFLAGVETTAGLTSTLFRLLAETPINELCCYRTRTSFPTRWRRRSATPPRCRSLAVPPRER